jgi:hypothetical protein
VREVRRYDSRLQVEMLRAHMPDKFKTPGPRCRSGSGAAKGGLG